MPLFIPITKVDVAKRMVYGTLSEEVADKTGEILDYNSAKPAFEEWSRQFHEASGGKSLGNVRAMHGNIAAGKLTDISFDDHNKRIEGVAKVVDDDAWNKVLEGVYTGFSIGGGYAKRWPDPENPALMRYTPTLSEVSLVDNPAVPTATFSVIKIDGSTELRRFSHGLAKENGSEEENSESQLIDGLNWLLTQNTDEDIAQHITALLDYLNMEDENAEKNMKVEAKLYKGLQGQIHQLVKRLEQLERHPSASRAVLKAVDKSQDYKFMGENLVLDKLPAQERAKEMIKIALANPQSY